MGMERLKEALEANDWESNELGDALNLDDFEVDDEEGEGSIGFGIDPAEMEMEMRGMKQAIYSGHGDETDGEEGHDEDIEQLQGMMLKMQAVRGKFYQPRPKYN